MSCTTFKLCSNIIADQAVSYNKRWAIVNNLWHPWLLINGLLIWFLSSFNENSVVRMPNDTRWKRTEIPLEISAGSSRAGEMAWSFYKNHRAHVGTISQPATWSVSFRNVGLTSIRDNSESALFIFLTIQTTILEFHYLQKISHNLLIYLPRLKIWEKIKILYKLQL